MGLLDEAIREHLELKRLRGADPVDVARMEREALGPARRPAPEVDPLGDAVAEVDAPLDYEPADVGFATPAPEDEALSPTPGVYNDEAAARGHDATGEADYGADLPAVEEWDDRPSDVPTAADYADHELAAGPPLADDRSIAPAAYGQETAEFDVEAAVLGHEPAAADPASQARGESATTAPDVSDEPPIAPPPAPDEPGPYGAVVDHPQERLADAESEAPASGAEDPSFAVEEQPGMPPDPSTAPRPREHPLPASAGGEQAEAGEAEGTEEDVLEETPDFLQETPEHERLWFEQRPPRDFDFDK